MKENYLYVVVIYIRKYGTIPKTSNNNVTKKTLANSIGHNKCQEFSLVYPRDF